MIDTLGKTAASARNWVTTPFSSSVWAWVAVWQEFNDRAVFKEKSDCSLIAV
jgi:hypothetical protein